jgi:hypothetical protein
MTSLANDTVGVERSASDRWGGQPPTVPASGEEGDDAQAISATRGTTHARRQGQTGSAMGDRMAGAR